jgi:hypothetical protein
MKTNMRICWYFRPAFAIVIGLAAGGTARAGSVPFTFTTTASPTTLTATNGSAHATLTETPIASGSGVADTDPLTDPIYVAIANITLTRTSTSKAYTFNQSIIQDVTVTDTATGKTGEFVLTEDFSIPSGIHANITVSIEVADAQQNGLVIGNYLYEIGETGQTFNNHLDTGSLEIGLYASAVPEPSTLNLAGMGVVGAIAYGRLRRRKA